MTITNRFLPIFSIALLAIVAVLPWGLSADKRYVLPLLPYVAIYFWNSRYSGLLPEWVPFFAGLTVDVLSNGPLGFWSLIYLLGFILSSKMRHIFGGVGAGRWLMFLSSLTLLLFASWSITSLYSLEKAEWGPFIWAAVMAGLAYPVLTRILASLSPQQHHSASDRMVRRL
ncbi:MAG: hypothetical protein ACKOW3_01550 [Hyphomicrobium sp.]